MRRLAPALAVLLLSALLPSNLAVAATAKAGGTCTKLNSTSTVNGYKFTCVKSGKKLVWSKGVKVVEKPTPAVTPAPVASPTPSVSATPTPSVSPSVSPSAAATPSPTPSASATPTPSPSPTPEKTYATLWEKYGWNKPSTALEVSKAATEKFLSYIATERNPAAEVKVIAQDGVDPLLTSWVDKGANLVAKTFDYPKLTRSFVDVIAIDRSWLESAYTKEGFSAQQVRDRLGGFDSGSPAFGGSFSNTWNYSTIKKNNLLVNDKSGMAQTAGHEFFHAIQERLAGRNPGPDGATIPNWIWEGPAMFIGLQTSSKLGIVDYLTAGQQSSINRYKNDSEAMKKLPLSEVKKNDKDTDPYGLGEVATEFIVANAGIEKLLGIYAALGQGKSFAQAFEAGTGVKLDDFYSMFEESRPTLGVPLGLSANAAASPSPAPSATPSATPTPTSTPTVTKKASYSNLWEKYGLTKPTSAESVATSATKAFTSFTDVVRSPNQVVVVKVQEGADPVWNNLISPGMELVAKSFSYPSFNGPVYALAGLDSAWMVSTFVSLGFTKDFAEKRVSGFDDVVANAGGNTAIWNITKITKNNSFVTNKVGIYQTPGHEFFHPIQQKLLGKGDQFPADGSGGPQWFLEGSAVFIGVQAANKLGQISYNKESRPNLVSTVLSDPATRNGKLADAKANLNRAGDVFPYNIGALGVEFLVANVGIQNLVDVFSQMGTGKSFAVAFEAATGIELVDFYAMFEEARPTLGIALGAFPPVVPAPAPSVAPTPTASTGPAKYTMENVKKHTSAADCWAVVSGSVYDLTKWAALHPGGPAVIQSLCGRDATADFLGRHSTQPDPARELANYLLGKLD
jgi:hypothetical protein